MKRDACSRKRSKWTALHVHAGTTAGLLPSGRRFNRNCVTSATPTVLDTTTATTTIGEDEFHSLSNRPHLTSASNLLVQPAKGLGSKPGPYLFFILEIALILSINTPHARHSLSGRDSHRQSVRHHSP